VLRTGVLTGVVRYAADFGPGMGPGRGMGMGPMGGPGMGPMGPMMDGPMRSMGGMRPMGGMGVAGMGPMGGMGGIGPMGGMGPMGPMMGRGGMMPGGHGPAAARLAMMEQQAMLMKRRRMMEAGMSGMDDMLSPLPGGGGIRGGAPPEHVNHARVPAPRPPAPGARPGFLSAKGAGEYRNGGMGPPPDPKIMALINDAVTPQAILHLWSDVSQAWSEGHLGHGLMRFAQLVEEICPEDILEVRARAACCRFIASLLPCCVCRRMAF
jgi:hypothetical protein